MEDRLARMEVLLRTVTEHTQSQAPAHSPPVSHSEINASVLGTSPSMSQNRSRAASRLQVADTEPERLQSPQDPHSASSPGHSIGTVVHVASARPQTAITAACPDTAAFASSSPREHGSAAESPGFRSLLTLASDDLELPSVISQRPDMSRSSMSGEPIAATAQAPIFSSPVPITVADAPTEGPERTNITARDDSWQRDTGNIVVEQPMTPPSLAAADGNDKALELNSDAPRDEVRLGLMDQATRIRLCHSIYTDEIDF